MFQTVNECDFHDAFRACDRLTNFSYEGRSMLFDYFEQYEEDTGTPVELDVIAICCDFNEDTPEDIADNYGIDISEAEGDSDEVMRIVLEYLNDETMVVGSTDSTIVYQAF